MLDPRDVERIATRVVELLHDRAAVDPERPDVRFVDATTVARLLSVDRDWVYAHAGTLGAVRLGGPRGRLRFDLHALDDHLEAVPQDTDSGSSRPRRQPRSGAPQPCPSPGRQRRSGAGRGQRLGVEPVELLPIGPEPAPARDADRARAARHGPRRRRGAD